MHEVAYYNAYYTNSKKPGSLSIVNYGTQTSEELYTQSDNCEGRVMLDYTVSVKETEK